MGTISRKLGVDELPPSSSEAATEAETEAAVVLIGDHEDRGRTGNYILISVIFVRLLHPRFWKHIGWTSVDKEISYTFLILWMSSFIKHNFDNCILKLHGIRQLRNTADSAQIEENQVESVLLFSKWIACIYFFDFEKYNLKIVRLQVNCMWCDMSIQVQLICVYNLGWPSSLYLLCSGSSSMIYRKLNYSFSHLILKHYYLIQHKTVTHPM